jgi:hypothetical protein
VQKSLHELDPKYGVSLDTMMALVRRGELKFDNLPACLNPVVGFETRFHTRRICNFTFTELHKGYTRGSHLVNFVEDLRFLRDIPVKIPATFNIDDFKNTHGYKFSVWNIDDFLPAQNSLTNIWYQFMFAVTKDVTVHNLNGSFQFTYETKVNGQYYPTAHCTAVGSLVQVLDAADNRVKPCETPIRFKDVDWMWTSKYKYDISAMLDMLKITVKDRGRAVSYLINALWSGEGALSTVKRHPDVFGKFSIPQLQLSV